MDQFLKCGMHGCLRMSGLFVLAMVLGLGVGAQADDGQWTMATKDYANSRFSELDQINVGNAKQLKLSWKFSTGVFRGQEAAPLVIGDTMYVVTPFPN